VLAAVRVGGFILMNTKCPPPPPRGKRREIKAKDIWWENVKETREKEEKGKWKVKG
jgi:hypothetical protein